MGGSISVKKIRSPFGHGLCLKKGILAGPKKNKKGSIMKWLFARKRRKLYRLFSLMKKIGDRYNLTIAQVAMAFVSSKGIIPICGCRRPEQVEQLNEAINCRLSAQEIYKLEQVADELNVKIIGKDIFRFAVARKNTFIH